MFGGKHQQNKLWIILVSSLTHLFYVLLRSRNIYFCLYFLFFKIIMYLHNNVKSIMLIRLFIIISPTFDMKSDDNLCT